MAFWTGRALEPSMLPEAGQPQVWGEEEELRVSGRFCSQETRWGGSQRRADSWSENCRRRSVRSGRPGRAGGHPPAPEAGKSAVRLCLSPETCPLPRRSSSVKWGGGGGRGLADRAQPQLWTASSLPRPPQRPSAQGWPACLPTLPLAAPVPSACPAPPPQLTARGSAAQSPSPAGPWASCARAPGSVRSSFFFF